MKRILTLTLAVLLVFSMFTVTASAALKVGDADESGNVDANDASFILRYLVDLATLTTQGYANADANCDKTVSSADSATILRYLVGLGSLGTPASETTIKVTANAKVTAASYANLRKGPSVYYDIIAYLPTDTTMDVYHYDAGYYYINVTGTETWGYVAESYITLTNDRILYEGTVTYNGAKLCSDTAMGSPLTSLTTGTVVGIIDTVSGVYLVRTMDGKYEGYMTTTSVSKGKSIDANAVKLSTVPKDGGGYDLTGYDVTGVGVTTAKELYLRKGASSDTAKLKSVMKGATVYALEKTIETSTKIAWLHVLVPNGSTLMEGYIKYVEGSATYINFPNGRIFKTVHVKADTILREGTSASSTSLHLFASETQVGVLEMSDNYWKVITLDGEFSGYVYLDYFVYGTEASLDSDFAATLKDPTPSTPGSEAGVPDGTRAQGVANSAVYIWTEPSANSTKLGTVSQNAVLYIFDTVDDKDGVANQSWYYVQVKGASPTVKGYIVASYVDLSTDYILYFAYPAPAKTGGYVYLRASSSTSAEKLAKLYSTDKIGILGYVKEHDGDIWYKVRVISTGLEGWMLETDTNRTFVAADFPDGETGETTVTDWDKVVSIGAMNRNANCYYGAGTGYEVCQALTSGSQVLIYDTTTGTDGQLWYKIKTAINASAYSYVQKAYITLVAPIMVNPVLTGDMENVKLRKSSSTSATVVNKLVESDRLAVTGYIVESDGDIWYKVQVMTQTSNNTGYVLADQTSVVFIAETKAAPATAGGTVKLYSSSNTSGSVAATVADDTALLIYAYSYDSVDSSLMFRVFVFSTGEWGYAEAAETDLAITEVKLAAAGTKLYKKAATSSTVLATYEDSMLVGVITTADGWSYVFVLDTGACGYMKTSALS